ncbi:thioredoxin-like protein [Aulographum hederae CBS 113979]|uniref:Thioredoxin-like protein n=1 Tax=Aulographum hederae CBS 113979 TaxID=1176131 RepID=A0A6G1GK18_9PEZI|nr:thioredoxin-like protein [Aulographum hederae CBS 113979]
MVKNIDIKVVSDTVCPWCYVGKQRMDKAISEFQSFNPASPITFTTTWYPFYLNPAAPKIGEDKNAMYARKFGEERMKMMRARMLQIGEAEGINFKWGGKTGNTRDTHRLLQLGKSKSPEVQTRVVEELFKAYHENEQDPTSHEVLQKVGEDAGLDAKEVKEWLGSDKGGPLVDREVEEAQRRYIQGVPHFTIQGKYELEGAQEPSAFLQIFKMLKDQDA